MNKYVVRRCREIIASPHYYRNRAVDMGGIYGEWCAELAVLAANEDKVSSARYEYVRGKARQYERRMLWYAKKIEL